MINSVTFEKYYPLVGASMALLMGMHFKFDLSQHPSLVVNLLTISSIFFGFIGTLAGIILSSNSNAIQFMKRINKLDELYKYIIKALQFTFTFILYCILIQVCPYFLNQRPFIWIWIFLGTFSILLVYRAISITATLLKSATFEK